MNSNFKLNKIEEKMRKILLLIMITITLLVVKGIINDSNNVNQNYILAPIVLLLCIFFCVIYTINAFTSGNLVKNWSHPLVFKLIFEQIKNMKSIENKNATNITIKIFGIFTFILGVFFLSIFAYCLYINNWG